MAQCVARVRKPPSVNLGLLPHTPSPTPMPPPHLHTPSSHTFGVYHMCCLWTTGVVFMLLTDSLSLGFFLQYAPTSGMVLHNRDLRWATKLTLTHRLGLGYSGGVITQRQITKQQSAACAQVENGDLFSICLRARWWNFNQCWEDNISKSFSACMHGAMHACAAVFLWKEHSFCIYKNSGVSIRHHVWSLIETRTFIILLLWYGLLTRPDQQSL